MPDEPNDAVDTGEPIAELADFAGPAPQGFLARVRLRIDRRQVGSHLLALSWHGTAAVFFEFLRFFFEPFQSDNKGGPS